MSGRLLRKIVKTVSYAGVTVLCLLFVFSSLVQDNRPPIPVEHAAVKVPSREEIMIQATREVEPVFVIAMCHATKAETKIVFGSQARADVRRQVLQAEGLLKSAAALTEVILRFIVLTDSRALYDDLVRMVEQWPMIHRTRVRLQRRTFWLPDDRKDLRSNFRGCATQKLFVPMTIADFDSVVYLDSDVVFMRPPEQLWNHFDRFNSKQLVAVAPTASHDQKMANTISYNGDRGIDAGVIMFNLTRIQSFPDGWIDQCLKVFDEYRKILPGFDKDILGRLLKKYPQYMYELGCEWNYKVATCGSKKGKNLCPAVENSGVSLLHGNSVDFNQIKDMKIETVFETWREHHLENPLKELYGKLRENLVQIKQSESSKCSFVNRIDEFLTKGLLSKIMN